MKTTSNFDKLKKEKTIKSMILRNHYNQINSHMS